MQGHHLFAEDSQPKQTPEQRFTEQNKVIVRVWTSKIDGKPASALKVIQKFHRGEKEGVMIGHVSVETPAQYVSLWPDEDEEVTNIFKLYSSRYEYSSIEDDLAEGGIADTLVCLYSLNIQAIDKAFDKIQASNVGYVLIGDSVLSEKGGQSCSSLAYYLLRAGGIDKLHPTKSSTMASAIITPNDFAIFIRETKQQEVTKYPHTLNFERVEDEYLPEKKQPSQCVIS